jgi:hypothetical protein
LALSPFDIWGDILETNRPAIDTALAGYIRYLLRIKERLGLHEMKSEFEEAAKLAGCIRGSG